MCKRSPTQVGNIRTIAGIPSSWRCLMTFCRGWPWTAETLCPSVIYIPQPAGSNSRSCIVRGSRVISGSESSWVGHASDSRDRCRSSSRDPCRGRGCQKVSCREDARHIWGRGSGQETKVHSTGIEQRGANRSKSQRGVDDPAESRMRAARSVVCSEKSVSSDGGRHAKG